MEFRLRRIPLVDGQFSFLVAFLVREGEPVRVFLQDLPGPRKDGQGLGAYMELACMHLQLELVSLRGLQGPLRWFHWCPRRIPGVPDQGSALFEVRPVSDRLLAHARWLPAQPADHKAFLEATVSGT